ncbi:MAG TPA: glycosyltransferase family 4 protein, partial [Blastocatellia bacterium]|nr:glycosyltransferase family 4 protein [Blastocatellia bacterium]
WVRIPAFKRPMALLFICFHLLAPLYYLIDVVWRGSRYDLKQMVESNLSFGDVSYSHFCHRGYLKHQWPLVKVKGVRGWLRWLDHWLHALVEPYIYRRVQTIIAASRGLARELKSEYPWTADKILVIPNSVNLERMLPPPEFSRANLRRDLNLQPDELALLFIALGHYERKGMPLILEALQKLKEVKSRLLVVGGEDDLIQNYQARVKAMGLSNRVTFVGMQRDVRPYLWSSDAFLFPSYYEVFPLVSLEAAAAGLPLMITPLNGVEEFLVNGRNGILLDRSVEGIEQGIRKLVKMPLEHRARLGEQARNDVSKYSVENFLLAWQDFYANQ